ncbi:MAG TPA: endonuclease/exonuclease/phosphatase family protein [Steroidobacteraceae bacterium]
MRCGTWADALRILLVGLAAASVAAALAPLGWPFELFAHFRWQLAAAGLALLLASLGLRKPWMIGLALLSIVLQAVPLLLVQRSHAAAAPPATCNGPEITVATVNLQFDNTDHERAIEWLQKNRADVVLLQEVTPEWADAFARANLPYPYASVAPRQDPYGIALLSRWPIVDVHAADLAGDGLPSVVGIVLAKKTTLQVVGLHTHWPLLPGLSRSRDRALEAAAVEVHKAGVDSVLLGDLNLTPYAPEFARLLERTGLRDAFGDRLWRPTWQAGLWPVALPIDHVLVPASSCVVKAEIGPSIGSDHRPVRVTFRRP